MAQTIITKRDGAEENFDKNKIRKVLIAAGLQPTQSEQLANNVEEWLTTNNFEKINSLKLRDKILEELQKVDQIVANLYQWYESTKDTKTI